MNMPIFTISNSTIFDHRDPENTRSFLSLHVPKDTQRVKYVLYPSVTSTDCTPHADCIDFLAAMSKGKKRSFIVLELSGIILLIVGIVLIVKACSSAKDCKPTDKGTSSGSSNKNTGNRCEFSKEAVSSSFAKFLQKVEDSYYKVRPENIVYKRNVTVEEIKRVFKPYDPSWKSLKKATDTAMELLDEVKGLKINTAKLKPREKKALFRVKHYLQFNFATPYDGNYYAGDYMMGPNLFCWQPICHVPYQVKYALRYFQPKEVKDLETLRDKLALFNQTYHTYIQNLKDGIKAGMVRSVEECVAGLNAIKRTFFQVALKGPTGILDEEKVKDVLSDKFLKYIMNKTEDLKKWESTHGKKVNQSVRGYLVDYLGTPVDKLFKYLEYDFAHYCVPSNISSGLASLPLSYIYINGTNTGTKTTKKLPSGDVLDGKKSYTMIMPYFTTNDMTPDEVYKLGFEMLHKLYPEVLEVARNVHNEANNDTAKELFIKRLNESDMYYADYIPANENGDGAHNNCSSIEGAKKYCPYRWAAMQKWFKDANEKMSFLDPKTVNMFHFNGYKHTTPNCPVQMRPNFNPSSGAQSFSVSDSKCSIPAYYNIPFFNARPGPKYEEMSVNAHEARPGHHTQVQGLVEHFKDTCGGVIRWLDSVTSYTAFTEGWALYAENPLIAKETDTYDNRPFDKYGMLKWQVWRALRLIVDTGLHYKGFSRQKALKYFADYAWDTSDGASKEVTRYQSDPGQATAYMIGQLQIIKLREYAKTKLGKRFNLRDFHFYLLAQGSSPLSYLKESIERYVECTLNEGKGDGCYDVLNPVGNDDSKAAVVKGVFDDKEWNYDTPEKPVLDEYM